MSKFVKLATLLNTTAENVENAFKSADENAFDVIVDSFSATRKVLTNTAIEQLKEDTKKDYVSELAVLAKTGQLPKEIHSPIKGAILEQATKDFSERYGIKDHAGNFEELIAKIAKNDVNIDSERAKYAELKSEHTKIVGDYEEKLKNSNKAVIDKLTAIEENNLLNSLSFDEEEAVIPKKRELLKTIVKAKYESRYDEKTGKVLLYDGDKVVKNPTTLEPIEPKDIYMSIGEEYGFKFKTPDNGGRGDAGTNTPNKITKEAWETQRKAEGKGNTFTLEDIEYAKQNFINT